MKIKLSQTKLPPSLLLALLFFVSVNISGQSNDETKLPPQDGKEQRDSHCIDSANYGSKTICLPQVEGMKQCYNEKYFQRFVNKDSRSGEMVLGFYLNKDVHEKFVPGNEICLGDWFKVVGLEALANAEVEENELELMSGFTSMFSDKVSWEMLHQTDDGKMASAYREMEKNIVVDEYQLHKRAFTTVQLVKVGSKGSKQVKLQYSSLVYMHKQLVSVIYYLNYTDKNSLSTVKERGDRYTIELLLDNI